MCNSCRSRVGSGQSSGAGAAVRHQVGPGLHIAEASRPFTLSI